MPLDFYSRDMIEANSVTAGVFNFVFEKIDPKNFKILGNTASVFFQKHY